MKLKYTLTTTTLNQLYNFAKLYERLHFVDSNSKWFKEVREISRKKSALAAVTFKKENLSGIDLVKSDAEIEKILNKEAFANYNNYLATLSSLKEIFKEEMTYSVDLIENLHQRLLGDDKNKIKPEFRKGERVLPKYMVENNVYKTLEMKVKTAAEDIIDEMAEFLNWMNERSLAENPILVAAYSHLRIAQIHPFKDGNGRLARIFENGVLNASGYDWYDCISLEDYYLQKLEMYYGIIEETIESGDLTKWFEFYTNGLLHSINKTFNLFFKVSGGTIDLESRKVIHLTEKEIEVIDILVETDQASGAEIAKILSVTRQNINVILKRLESKKAVLKLGSGTSSRYKLNI